MSAITTLSVVNGGKVEAAKPPEPPAELTELQATEWRAIAAALPADWFRRETWPLLAQYCRHIIAARRVAQLAEQCEQADAFDLLEYDRLGKMAERESRVLTSLATKMRISQQSLYDKSKRKGSVAKRPWDD